MATRAAELVAGIIDRIEGRPYRTGRPPLPTIQVVETLRFFVREGVSSGAAAAAPVPCGSGGSALPIMAGAAGCGRARVRLHPAPSLGRVERRGLAAPGPCRPGPAGARRTRDRSLGRGRR